MFVRTSEDSPNLFVLGGSKCPEWVLTVEELDELRMGARPAHFD